jgi:hypothetical protein
MRICSIVVLPLSLALSPISAPAQSTGDTGNLPRVLEGKWENTERCCFSGPIRLTIESVASDGKITGTFFRTTPDGQHCSIRGEPVPMTGTFDGTTLTINPEIKQRLCENSQFTFERKSSGRFEGTGVSYFQLKAFLEPKP